MPLPESLNPLIDGLLQSVRSHPQHQLAPLVRRQLYDAFGSRENPEVDRARSWLAIMTTKRVLPLFEYTFPENRLPPRLVNVAERVVQGRLRKNSWRVGQYLEYSYHASGNFWDYEEEDVPWNVYLAGYAARKALSETCGTEPLTNLGFYSRTLDLVTITTGDQFTDEELCSIEVADTASAAAVAFACGANSPYCDPSKLLSFWEWWLLEAIPAVWFKAAQH